VSEREQVEEEERPHERNEVKQPHIKRLIQGSPRNRRRTSFVGRFSLDALFRAVGGLHAARQRRQWTNAKPHNAELSAKHIHTVANISDNPEHLCIQGGSTQHSS
jgi:hypothetical protein